MGGRYLNGKGDRSEFCTWWIGVWWLLRCLYFIRRISMMDMVSFDGCVRWSRHLCKREFRGSVGISVVIKSNSRRMREDTDTQDFESASKRMHRKYREHSSPGRLKDLIQNQQHKMLTFFAIMSGISRLYR